MTPSKRLHDARSPQRSRITRGKTSLWVRNSLSDELTGLTCNYARPCRELTGFEPFACAEAIRIACPGAQYRGKVLLHVCSFACVFRPFKGCQMGVPCFTQHLQRVVRPNRKRDPRADRLFINQSQGAIQISLTDAIVEIEHVVWFPARNRLGGVEGLCH